MAMLYCLSVCNTQGEPGEKGELGEKGETGMQGLPGKEVMEIGHYICLTPSAVGST